jgi:two-component system chemotaxis response regulator CheY
MVKALVIDDSSATRMILGKMLREIGFEVKSAVDGQDAIRCLEEGYLPQVMLVDWNMPVMDGYEFLKAVRGREVYDDVPLMMVTTETEMDRVLAALEAGANEYVMKPFSKEVIMDKLAMLGFGDDDDEEEDDGTWYE